MAVLNYLLCLFGPSFCFRFLSLEGGGGRQAARIAHFAIFESNLVQQLFIYFYVL